MDHDELSATMRALSHPVRLEILRILSRTSHQCCCNDITDCLSLAQSTVSQHLKVLLDAGIIERKTSGTRNNYRVRTDRLDTFTTSMSGYVGELASARASCTSMAEKAS